MKPKFQKLYSNIAKEVAKISYARRLQVGAVIVKNDRVISMGYNGMPSGWENDCEYRDYMNTDSEDWFSHDEIIERWPDHDEKGRYAFKTRPEVLHAEMNALMKLAKSTDSGEGASMFITHSPCIECAKGIYQAGIKQVFYNEEYRSSDGVRFLKQCGIEVIKNDE